jgi:hypothetical protein
MVFPALGPNLLDLIKKFDSKGLPIPIVKVLCKQILIGLGKKKKNKKAEEQKEE